MAKQISERTNVIINFVISFGAAIVIIGALAKIIHLSWANYALVVGLLTEALIFVIYAFLPPPPVDHGSGSVGVNLDTTELVSALGKVEKTVGDVATNLGLINSSTEGLKNLNQQFLAMSKTVEELNQFYGNLKELTASMSNSTTEALRTKEQLTALADNLTKLNQVYGNMIQAIQGK